MEWKNDMSEAFKTDLKRPDLTNSFEKYKDLLVDKAIEGVLSQHEDKNVDKFARENIYLNGALLGYSKKYIDERFDEIVDFAEVRDFLDMPMKNYSSGMVARVAFSVATATIPDILVVDEALSVGDFLFQEKCEARINDLVQNHQTTLLFVSHSIEQVERVCEKAVWIEKGHMRMVGSVEDEIGRAHV